MVFCLSLPTPTARKGRAIVVGPLVSIHTAHFLSFSQHSSIVVLLLVSPPFSVQYAKERGEVEEREQEGTDIVRTTQFSFLAPPLS